MLSKQERQGTPVPTLGGETAPLQAEGVKHTKAEIKGGRRERRDSQWNQRPPVPKEAGKGEKQHESQYPQNLDGALWETLNTMFP